MSTTISQTPGIKTSIQRDKHLPRLSEITSQALGRWAKEPRYYNCCRARLWSGIVGSRGVSYLSGWACVVLGSGCEWSAPHTWDTERVCRGRLGWASLCCWWREQCTVGRDTERSPDYKKKGTDLQTSQRNDPRKNPWKIWTLSTSVWEEGRDWHVTFLLKSSLILEISGSGAMCLICTWSLTVTDSAHLNTPRQ